MSDKKIPVLGSGMVARPCVEYLIRDVKNYVTVACQTLSAVQALTSSLPRTEGISLDVPSADLDPQVAAHDLVIPLVPYIYHAAVIKSAIKSNTNVVVTSYISPVIRELDAAAREADIVVLNEVGVDPGIDHLYNIKTINEIHAKGGKEIRLASSSPGPHAGALLSQHNSASYISEGKQMEISAKDLMSFSKPYLVTGGYTFVVYPSRSSIPFRGFYIIQEAETVIRRSLRYKGNPEFVQVLVGLG